MANIKENILEMKKVSELMMDLAYSAVFLHDKNMAAEIQKLYHKIQELEKDTLSLLFRIKESEDERMFLIDLISNISEVSYRYVRISRLSASQSFPEIVHDILRESDKRIVVALVTRKSRVANKTISDSEIRTKTKATIIAIKRKNEWICNIDENVKLLPNDQIVAIGRSGSEALLKELIS